MKGPRTVATSVKVLKNKYEVLTIEEPEPEKVATGAELVKQTIRNSPDQNMSLHKNPKEVQEPPIKEIVQKHYA